MALHFDLMVNLETIGTFYARRLHETCGEINAYEWVVTNGGQAVGEVERQKQERIAYSLEA